MVNPEHISPDALIATLKLLRTFWCTPVALGQIPTLDANGCLRFDPIAVSASLGELAAEPVEAVL